MDSRTPVIVGVGQVDGRLLGGDGASPEPVDLMAAAARLAGEDASASALLTRLDSVRVVSLLSWYYRDPARLLAERLGASARHTVLTGIGGNEPQELVTSACQDIAAGRASTVLVAGGESWRTRMKARARGEKPDWTRQADDLVPDEVGENVPLSSEHETSLGLTMPVQLYPLFEQALRISGGRTVDEQLDRAAGLWSRFSEVAAANPHAWRREALDAETIRTPGPKNRWVGWPYPKLMNSNNDVDQGSALLVCSVETAQAAGVPREQWVFPHAGTRAHDTYAVTERPGLDRSPAIRVAGRRALELAGIGIDDPVAVDLYSCFPSAVQVAAAELGLPVDDPARPLTVTGGLTFAGGPWNNYVGHAIAAMVTRLRSEGSATGLVTANGGFLTKHAIGVYGTEPPAEGFRAEDVQAEVDAAEAPTPAADSYVGPGRVESWTVMHGREGPEKAFVAVRTPDERRAWGVSEDPSVLAELLERDIAGEKIQIASDAALDLG
ncbi:acetyl-CoA acetyltransferase [Actinomycetospora endophytica]|uniref:Acetyl-CoA acetyltransferase n=1 Tax=Actinomycetospora endophytica TaxID=2291215 RepID=A0ABS8P8Y8_9PSEU|nr:acetyl-CoA acetyltransferase [Actinomycetospora endophytica]MCD2194729.1 acetyl-CoA acetyltransferase [Actinomycetospora endophytica]